MNVTFEPVYDAAGRFQLCDMFVDGVWHGSRRTYPQCLEYLRGIGT